MSVPSASEPLVTIGMPVYNCERYVRESLDSLLAQTYRDFVMVICDNASTDGTGAICQEYARKDPRVRYHRNPVNLGMTGNFNRVFELTRTKYIKWSTADDYWAPDMLADAVAIMEADPSIVVCYPLTTVVDDEGIVKELYAEKLHMMQDDPAKRFRHLIENIEPLVNHHLGLLRCDAVRKTRLFGRHVSADIGFLAEMSLYGKFYEMPKRQFFRRFHEDSSSWNRGNEEHDARRFHAANVRRVPFNNWRFEMAYVNSILRGPLSLAVKARLLGWRLKSMYWRGNVLYEDLRRDIPFASRFTRKQSAAR